MGDDDQSIYGFRGARPEIMLEFRKDYPNAAVIRMSINYRSGSEIIRQAGALITDNRKRFEKEFVGARSCSGRVTVIPSEDRRAEIGLLVQRIRAEIADPGGGGGGCLHGSKSALFLQRHHPRAV